MISEASALLVLYIIGYLIIKWLQSLELFTVSQSDYIRIRREYLLLCIILIMRIFYHSFLRFTTFYQYQPQVNCSDFKYYHKIIRTVLLSIDHGFMHMISAGLVIYIYRPNINEIKRKSESLLSVEVYLWALRTFSPSFAQIYMRKLIKYWYWWYPFHFYNIIIFYL